MRSLASSELVAAAQAGDATEIDRLLETVWPAAYRLARAIVPQRHAAEDAAQDACVIMYRGIASLREPAAFGTWFYRIVVREAIKQKKALAASVALDLDASYAEDPAVTIDLMRALATLSDAQRSAVVLHYFEGLSGREIAAVLRVPHATVRFRLMTARRRLQHLLQYSDSSAQVKGEGIYAL